MTSLILPTRNTSRHAPRTRLRCRPTSVRRHTG